MLVQALNSRVYARLRSFEVEVDWKRFHLDLKQAFLFPPMNLNFKAGPNEFFRTQPVKTNLMKSANRFAGKKKNQGKN